MNLFRRQEERGAMSINHVYKCKQFCITLVFTSPDERFYWFGAKKLGAIRTHEMNSKIYFMIGKWKSFKLLMSGNSIFFHLLLKINLFENYSLLLNFFGSKDII